MGGGGGGGIVGWGGDAAGWVRVRGVLEVFAVLFDQGGTERDELFA